MKYFLSIIFAITLMICLLEFGARKADTKAEGYNKGNVRVGFNHFQNKEAE